MRCMFCSIRYTTENMSTMTDDHTKKYRHWVIERRSDSVSINIQLPDQTTFHVRTNLRPESKSLLTYMTSKEDAHNKNKWKTKTQVSCLIEGRPPTNVRI